MYLPEGIWTPAAQAAEKAYHGENLESVRDGLIEYIDEFGCFDATVPSIREFFKKGFRAWNLVPWALVIENFE